MNTSPLLRFICVLLVLCNTLHAFPYDDTLDDLPLAFSQTGATTRADGSSFTYNIPANNWPELIDFRAIQGGDGGKGKATADVGSDKTGDGGGGAFIRCRFTIDPTASDALRPGGEIRIIIGSKGESKTRNQDAGGGGGGATGILYRAPVSDAEWEPLIIAGGGGGGAASTYAFDTFADDGENANVETFGDDSALEGGVNGMAGLSGSSKAGGGGGWLNAALTPNGGEGGLAKEGLASGGQHFNNGTFGGFGCGAGGAGWAKSTSSSQESGGGGGGGYSGGGAGNEGNGEKKAGGGGGGSYIDDRASSVISSTRNGQDLDGNVQYDPLRYTQNTQVPAPTITLTGSSSITLAYGVAYTEPGYSGADHYGNTLQVTVGTPNPLTSGVPGSHEVWYEVTDQFDTTTRVTRSVVILNPNPPTFLIAGDLSRNENSGSFSQSDFATNFNANDPGESLDFYTVINDNSALFSTQPAIDNNGTLTFVLEDQVFGSALVTVTATDTNSDSQYAESSPVTFTITVNEVPTPPSFSILGNLARSRDAGPQTISNFAFNFDANDAGESFDRYEVSNDSAALFSAQPSIDSAGTLTFTPAGNVFGDALVTVTGYDDGNANNHSQQTFTLSILDLAPTASFTFAKKVTSPNSAVQFTSTSSRATGWSWDFDNDGTIDSTEENPSHNFTTPGLFSPSLTVSNSGGTDTVTSTDTIRVVSYGLVNAGFDSTDIVNGFGTEESLGLGWYAQSGDDGATTDPHWSAGLTTATPGVLTQTGRGGSVTRMGQFFANNLTGSNWALSFDLGGTAGFEQVRMYAGTLADNPSGTVLEDDNGAPAGSLVSGNWTSLLDQPETNQEGRVVLNLDDQDLGQFNVIAIQFLSQDHVGTTFDNFALVPQVAPTAVDDAFDTFTDETISGAVLTNDTAAALNAPLAISAVNGEASSVGTEITLTSGALLTVSADGSFTYDPNGAFDTLSVGASTSDSFTYTVGTGSLSSTVTVTVVITLPPTPPSFSLLGDLVRARDAGPQTVSNFAFDFDANDVGEVFDRYEVSNDNTALFSAQPTIDETGSLTFTPEGDVSGEAQVTVTGYDDGIKNNSSQQTFTLTINDLAPTASFTFAKAVTSPNSAVQFTSTSSRATGWSWDFDNDGTIDSTAENPSYSFTSPGIFTPSLTVSNSGGSDTFTSTDTIRVVSYGIVNAGFDSTDIVNGFGTEESLGLGWYAQSGDDGATTGPHWSAGLTTATPGVLTQTGKGGSATRMGQFFANNLTGSNWALSFDLGGTAGFKQVRMYAGTLADNPSGTVLRNDNGAPTGTLVSGGWTSLLYQPETNQEGTIVLNLDDQDLSQFNVIAIQFRSEDHIGTTFDNFALIPQVAPTATDDAFEGTADETINDTLFTNDAASALNASLAVTAVDGEASSVGTEITLTSGALLTVSPDGSFSYDPNGAFNSLSIGTTRTESFTYTVGTGSLTSTATVTLEITVPDPVIAFRENYGLAEDGSDDNADWSGNGVSNIFYYAFGLGDPNLSDVDRTRLPQTSGNGEEMTFSYLRPIDGREIVIDPVVSKDLSTWTTLTSFLENLPPVEVTSEEVDEDYLRITYILPVSEDDCFLSVRSTLFVDTF